MNTVVYPEAACTHVGGGRYAMIKREAGKTTNFYTVFHTDSDCTDVPLHWTKANAACVALSSGGPYFKMTFTDGGSASDAQHTRAKLGLSAVAILSMLYAFV